MSLNIEVPYNQGAGLYLPLTGGALTGPLALGANKITGVANGTAATDAATYGQVQTTEAALNPALQYNDLLGWTTDPRFCGGSQGVNAAAQLMLMRIPLPGAMTITNVLIYVQALGVTLTHSYVALVQSNGTIAGQSADQSTVWEAGGSAGLKTIALAGGPTLVSPLAANDFIWAAVYIGTMVSSPGFLQLSLNTPLWNVNQGPARTGAGYIAQANTATLGSIIPANISQWQTNIWFGIS